METLLIRERYKIVQVLHAQPDYAFAEAVDIQDRQTPACLVNVYEGAWLPRYAEVYAGLEGCPAFQGAFLQGESLVAVFQPAQGLPIDRVFYRGARWGWRDRLEFAQLLLHQALTLCGLPPEIGCAALFSENVLVDVDKRRVDLRYFIRPLEGMTPRELTLLAADQVEKILLPRFSSADRGAGISQAAAPGRVRQHGAAVCGLAAGAAPDRRGIPGDGPEERHTPGLRPGLEKYQTKAEVRGLAPARKWMTWAAVAALTCCLLWGLLGIALADCASVLFHGWGSQTYLAAAEADGTVCAAGVDGEEFVLALGTTAGEAVEKRRVRLTAPAEECQLAALYPDSQGGVFLGVYEEEDGREAANLTLYRQPAEGQVEKLLTVRLARGRPGRSGGPTPGSAGFPNRGNWCSSPRSGRTASRGMPMTGTAAACGKANLGRERGLCPPRCCPAKAWQWAAIKGWSWKGKKRPAPWKIKSSPSSNRLAPVFFTSTAPV